LDRSLNQGEEDLLHLHWVQEEMLSIEAIGRLRKPLVWTLHDTWPFCGSEHYPNDLHDTRYEQGYFRSNRPSTHRGFDLDRWCWQRKVKHWRRPIQLVSPSSWLADCARRSALFTSWPVSVIPNPLSTDTYQPWPKRLAREMFGLPADTPLVLFGAFKGCHYPIKGWSLLEPALRLLADEIPGLHAVVFGQTAPPSPLQLAVPVRFVGRLHDDQSLAMLYSAADVMVVPSRMEAFGQTASEAQSCGTPVVAFNATGLMDVVEHKVSGYLAEPFSSRDLANGIAWILSDPQRYERVSSEARQRAIRLWREDVVVNQYHRLYQEVLRQRSSNGLK
jgi:glycosyltransferase involved in cell wall biosynthesis